MRKTYAAKLRNVLNASIANGRLSDILNELSAAELEFIAHDWELWARDEQLSPLLALGDSPPSIPAFAGRPPSALDVARDSSNNAAPCGRLREAESQGAIKQWRVWMLLGGRGSGKTRAGAEWIRGLACGEDPGPRSAAGSRNGSRRAPTKESPRIALVGKTLADVRNVMIEGQSGLLAVHPAHERPVALRDRSSRAGFTRLGRHANARRSACRLRRWRSNRAMSFPSISLGAIGCCV